MRYFLVLFLILALFACDDGRPPAPTAEESARLDDAEARLDAMANEEGAPHDGDAPSNSLAGPSRQ